MSTLLDSTGKADCGALLGACTCCCCTCARRMGTRTPGCLCDYEGAPDLRTVQERLDAIDVGPLLVPPVPTGTLTFHPDRGAFGVWVVTLTDAPEGVEAHAVGTGRENELPEPWRGMAMAASLPNGARPVLSPSADPFRAIAPTPSETP